MTDATKSIETMVIAGYQGVLIIGDPMLGAPKRIGRIDNVWQASFDKLSQALEIARERSLVPVIVGDLLHESRDIGQLLPIIELLKGHKAILLPRNGRWQEASEKHVAGILKAADICHVAGASARQFQIPTGKGNSADSLYLECYSSWGGVGRLDPGTPAHIKIKGMSLTVMQSSSLPCMEGDDEEGTRVVAGRLLRVAPSEEAMAIQVTAITPKGIELISLTALPVVFSTASSYVQDSKQTLEQDSRFVDKLREAAMNTLEEEGKESLMDLIEAICTENECDDWVRLQMLGLAKEATETDMA